jgi:hypothetical protein
MQVVKKAVKYLVELSKLSTWGLASAWGCWQLVMRACVYEDAAFVAVCPFVAV